MKKASSLLLILLGMLGLFSSGIEARDGLSCVLISVSFISLICGMLLHLSGVTFKKKR